MQMNVAAYLWIYFEECLILESLLSMVHLVEKHFRLCSFHNFNIFKQVRCKRASNKKKQKPKSSHTAEYVAIEIWWEAPSYNRTLPIYSSRCQNLRELYDMTLNVNYITKQKLWVKCTAVYYMKIFAKRMEERQRYNLLFWNSTTFHSSSLVCGAQVYRQNENAVGF